MSQNFFRESATELQSVDSNMEASNSTGTQSSNIFDGRKFDWWEDKVGSMYGLYIMNELRVPLVQDTLLGNKEPEDEDKPLDGFNIIDVGCGGGLLCEPIAKLGAEVIGIDISKESIEAAEEHMNESSPHLKKNLRYMNISVEELIRQQETLKFDAVVASEVVEHVDNVEKFIMNCMKLVKPGGYFIITTINRTLVAYTSHIVIGEKILGLLPQGTHQYNMLVKPEELELILKKGKQAYNPLTHKWSWIGTTVGNYCLVAHHARN